MTNETALVRRTVEVNAPLEDAFRVFVDGIGAWWPAELTFGGEAYEGASIDGPGGRWFERDRHGNERSWGEVRAWEPPRRIVLSWRVSPGRTQEPPERASEVEVRFREAASQRTQVEVTHRDFERHGEGADAMRAGMASDQGWARLLRHYRQEVG